MPEVTANPTPGSPEERAAAAVELFVRAVEGRKPWDAVACIAAAISAAVAEEREACVAAVAGMRDDFMGVEAFRRKVVAAIRARG